MKVDLHRPRPTQRKRTKWHTWWVWRGLLCTTQVSLCHHWIPVLHPTLIHNPSWFSAVICTKCNNLLSIKSALQSGFTHQGNVSAVCTFSNIPISWQRYHQVLFQKGRWQITSNCMSFYKCNNIPQFLKGIFFVFSFKVVIWIQTLWKTCVIILMIPLSSLNSNCGALETPCWQHFP